MFPFKFGHCGIPSCLHFGNGGPQTCLPAAWLEWGPSVAQLHQLKLKTLAKGQASLGGRQEASSRAASSGRLARRQRDQGRAPPEGPVTQSVTIEDQAGARRAPACAVSLFPFRCKGGKHRPRHQAKVSISAQQDQDQQDGRTEVTTEPTVASLPEPLAGEDHLLSG